MTRAATFFCVIDTLGEPPEPPGGKDSAAVGLPNCNCKAYNNIFLFLTGLQANETIFSLSSG